MSNRNKNYYTLSKHRIYHYDKLMRFLRNRYSYKFVDEDQRKELENKIPFRYLEKLVAMYGRGAVYKQDLVGYGVFKPVMAGNLNIYGNPGTYWLYTANGQETIKVQANDPNLLILQDNFDGSSFESIASYYAEQMGKTRETIVTNVHTMRVPFIITAPKEQLLAVRMALEAINEMPEVITDPNIMNDIKELIGVVDLKTPDHLKSLEDEYNITFSKFKEEIGFSSQNIDKKERLVAAEAEDDKDTLKAFDNEPYENRQKFITAMNDKFGVKLKLIKANDDLYAEPKETETE